MKSKWGAKEMMTMINMYNIYLLFNYVCDEPEHMAHVIYVWQPKISNVIEVRNVCPRPPVQFTQYVRSVSFIN